MSMTVKVKKSWISSDSYKSKEDIGINITDGGVLQIAVGDEIRSYSPRSWKTITSQKF